MEFIFGMIAAFFIGFIYARIQKAIERKKIRETYIPPAGSGFDRKIKDYPTKERPD